MKPSLHLFSLLAAILSLANPALAGDRAAAIMQRIRNPQAGLIVVAHRGCHNPAPHHGLAAAPENSLLGLSHCLAIGADVMETDVRRTADGHLVMIHDDSVDRTTNGTGQVEALTLAQIRALHLRENEGGSAAPLTDQQVPTLDEMLNAARGRIVLNLDVKAAVYGEVVAAVERAGMAEQVLIKNYVGIDSPPLAEIAPYDRVPFLPILAKGDGPMIAAAIARQSSGRVKPIGIELPTMARGDMAEATRAARGAGVRLWANSLWEGHIPEIGGDRDALRNPEMVWGGYIRSGISMIQTDEPEALRRYLDAVR